MTKKKTVKLETTNSENDEVKVTEVEVPEGVQIATPGVTVKGEVKEIADSLAEGEEKPRSWPELLADPEEQKNARFLATSIQASLRNWFTLERYMKKIKDDRQTAISRLFALKEFGYCLIKQERGEYKFKISFNDLDEIQLINDDLEILEVKKMGLVNRRKELHERYKQRQEILDKAEEEDAKKAKKKEKVAKVDSN